MNYHWQYIITMKQDNLKKTQIPPTGYENQEKPVSINDGLNESDLWNLFKAGDDGAFVKIYNDYTNLLFNFGCQFSPDREMVKDCLQDFFIYLREKRLKLGPTDSIKFYLLKSFRRKVVEYLKRNAKEMENCKKNGFMEFPIQFSHETIYINRQFEADQLSRLEKALQALDDREREAIYHFYYENLSYEQIAEIFEFSHVSSARRLIYRALSNLRKEMFLLLLLFSLYNDKQ